MVEGSAVEERGTNLGVTGSFVGAAALATWFGCDDGELLVVEVLVE